MSTTDSPVPPPAPRPRSRTRSVFFASALLLTGGVIGAVVAGPTFGQGWDGPPWHSWRHGQSYDQDSDSPPWQRGWRQRQSSDEDSGPPWRRGWRDRQSSDEDGGRPFWQRGGQMREFGGLGAGGARMFFPGRVERAVDRLARLTDASTEQKQKINTIAQKAADDLSAIREQHLAARKQFLETLAAPTIDRSKLESLRTDQMKLIDSATKRATTAVADIADVLTPAQRADLAQRIERWWSGSRG
jgi:Spy/CpxP family protein refolding chaperone